MLLFDSLLIPRRISEQNGLTFPPAATGRRLPHREFAAVPLVLAFGRAYQSPIAPADVDPPFAAIVTRHERGDLWRRGHLGGSSVVCGHAQIDQTESLSVLLRQLVSFLPSRGGVRASEYDENAASHAD